MYVRSFACEGRDHSIDLTKGFLLNSALKYDQSMVDEETKGKVLGKNELFEFNEYILLKLRE